jgi:hypothetical protein
MTIRPFVSTLANGDFFRQISLNLLNCQNDAKWYGRFSFLRSQGQSMR